MKVIQVLCDSKYQILSEHIEAKSLVSKMKKSKKRFGDFTYKGKSYRWKREVLNDGYIISFVDTTQIKKLEELAWIDQLTRAYNRNAYWEMLSITLEECARDGHDLGLIFIDIDNLKKINTEKGYVGGDKTIAGIAKILKKRIRRIDKVFRMGGDEFLILAKFGKNKKIAFHNLIKRIFTTIQRKSHLLSTASISGLHISHKKVVELDSSKKLKGDWTKIVVMVDQKVQLAKKSGKNVYVIDSI